MSQWLLLIVVCNFCRQWILSMRRSRVIWKFWRLDGKCWRKLFTSMVKTLVTWQVIGSSHHRSITFILMSFFHLNLDQLVVPLTLFFYLLQNRTNGTVGTGISTGWMSLLSLDRQFQSTERNSEHWPQLVRSHLQASSLFGPPLDPWVTFTAAALCEYPKGQTTHPLTVLMASFHSILSGW